MRARLSGFSKGASGEFEVGVAIVQTRTLWHLLRSADVRSDSGLGLSSFNALLRFCTLRRGHLSCCGGLRSVEARFLCITNRLHANRDVLTVRREHSLCDIVINCKTTGTEVKPNVVSCKAVSDHNLVTHHMLDVLNHHLMQTQGPLPRGGSAGAPGAGSGAFQSSSTQVAQAAILAHGIHGGGDSEIDWVLNVFKEIGTTTGDVSVDDVVSRAVQEGRRLDRARVAAFAERLMMDGHIYSTSDENHFMPSA